MCGRSYSDYTPADLRIRYFERDWPFVLHPSIPELPPTYNRCPTQTGLVLAVHQGTIGFIPMRWGLVPGWAKSVKEADKYAMINAKSEEVAEKKSYKAAFQHRRCIVPVSGFYEWKREGKEKQPFAISLIDDPIMSLAGIWEHWKDGETNQEVLSFSVLTTAANSFMSSIHSRMPVILDREQEFAWIDPECSDQRKLGEIMQGCPSSVLQATAITQVGNPI